MRLEEKDLHRATISLVVESPRTQFRFTEALDDLLYPLTELNSSKGSTSEISSGSRADRQEQNDERRSRLGSSVYHWTVAL